MNIKKTEKNIKRLARDFGALAGEEVTVDIIGDTLYVYGTELATLRLFKKYRTCGDRVRADYSINLKTFYFRLEMV